MKLSHLLIKFFATALFVTLSLTSALANIDVYSRADSGPGTLRQAIIDANGNTYTTLITFNALAGNSITVYSSLPQIIKPMHFIGIKTMTVIGGSDKAAAFWLLDFQSGSDGSIVQDLSLIDASVGIAVAYASNIKITGCRIGLNWSDTPHSNYVGIQANHADGLIIGGKLLTERNVISSNQNTSILIQMTTGAIVQGNHLGTNYAGNAPVASDVGIYLGVGCTGIMLGGDLSQGAGNLISGNEYGIYMYSCQGNSICGNVIGLDASQNLPIKNEYGIVIKASNNRLGLPQSGYGNIISGNNRGVLLSGGDALPCQNNVIQNNYIGINANAVLMPNAIGVTLEAYANNNLIGGNRAIGTWEPNVISGNWLDGVDIVGNGNTVCGNYIGLHPYGVSAIGNSLVGIHVWGNDNLIGGANSDSSHQYGNIVAGSSYDDGSAGVWVTGARNRLSGNWIGLDSTGSNALPNAVGILLGLSGACTDTLIGGSDPMWRNVVAGNNEDFVDYSSNRSTIIGNYFGTDISGTAILSPLYRTALTIRGTNSRIGGPGAEKNIICNGGGGCGINVQGNGNTIMSNWLGVLADGNRQSVPLGFGMQLSNNRNTWIGGKDSGQGNLIAGCGHEAFSLYGSNCQQNALFGNTICAFSLDAMPDGYKGIYLNLGTANAANNSKPAPIIHSGNACLVSGTAQANDYIEVFKSDRGAGVSGGSLYLAGSTLADTAGNWQLVPSGPVAGDYISALATDGNNNTSEFAENALVFGSTPTPTWTPSIPPTPTITSTANPLADMDLAGKQVLAFPNPAKEQIQFLTHLSEAAQMKAVIYNFSGERVAEIKADLPAGRGQVLVWDCHNTAPGIYYARVFLQSKEIQKIKLAVIK